jgi:hypothetical protein
MVRQEEIETVSSTTETLCQLTLRAQSPVSFTTMHKSFSEMTVRHKSEPVPCRAPLSATTSEAFHDLAYWVRLRWILVIAVVIINTTLGFITIMIIKFILFTV